MPNETPLCAPGMAGKGAGPTFAARAVFVADSVGYSMLRLDMIPDQVLAAYTIYNQICSGREPL